MEEIKVAPSDFPAFVTGEKGAAGVIVIQEWWGVTKEIKDHAIRISKFGFRVLIPDIYKGKIGVNAEEAHHLMDNLDFPGALIEIEQAAAYLKTEGSENVGIVGFCMGGALTFGALAKCVNLKCGAPFYGFNPALFDAMALKDKPLEAHFGVLDSMKGFSDVDTAKKIESELKEVGCENSTIFMYENVGHAFMNESPAPFESFEERKNKMDTPHFDKEVAEIAWNRLDAFFNKWLK